jgi:STE24 endopeptidase
VVFDASRQSKRVSANLSGFGSTLRISLNDNLMNRSSLPEIEAVMGHYVLNHTPRRSWSSGSSSCSASRSCG